MNEELDYRFYYDGEKIDKVLTKIYQPGYSKILNERMMVVDLVDDKKLYNSYPECYNATIEGLKNKIKKLEEDNPILYVTFGNF